MCRPLVPATTLSARSDIRNGSTCVEGGGGGSSVGVGSSVGGGSGVAGKGVNSVVRGKGSHVVGVGRGVAGGKGSRSVGRRGCGVGVERSIVGGRRGAAKRTKRCRRKTKRRKRTRSSEGFSSPDVKTRMRPMLEEEKLPSTIVTKIILLDLKEMIA